ncbi:GDSL family lipase, partial [bacterium]|nr:GDSL family lipase [bacterium]
KRLAAEHDAILVEVQAAFDAYLEHYHPAQLAWDRVHPTLTGHTIIARAWLEAVGCEK